MASSSAASSKEEALEAGRSRADRSQRADHTKSSSFAPGRARPRSQAPVRPLGRRVSARNQVRKPTYFFENEA